MSINDNAPATVSSIRTTSTDGNGFCNFSQQSVAPAAPSSGYSLYADSASNVAWKTTNNHVLKFDTSTASTSRTWTLPNATDTIVARSTTDILTNKTLGSTTNTVDATHIKTAPIVGAPAAGNFLTYGAGQWEPLALTASTPATYSSGTIGVSVGSSAGTLAAGNDARFSSPQIRTVKTTGTGAGEYSSIASAIASITDAAANKPYTIEVHPGVYSVAAFTIPAYVVISGYGAGHSTVISPSAVLGATDPFITIATNGGINGCMISGTGTGVAILTASAGTLFVNNIVFVGFTTFVNCTGATAVCNLTIFDCAMMYPFTYGIACEQASGSFAAAVTASGIITIGNGSSVRAFSAIGGLASIIVSNSTIRGLTTGYAIYASSGATVDTSSVQIDNCGYGIYSANVGSGPVIRAMATGIFNSTINGIFIDHPGTTGVYIGSVDRTMVTVDTASPFTLSYVDPTGGTVSIGDFAYSPFPGGIITDHGALLEYTSSLGTHSGGVVSVGTGLAVNVTAGEGYVTTGAFPNQQLLRVVWDAGTVGSLSADTTYYIKVIASATVAGTTAYPDRIGNIGTLSAVTSLPDQYTSLVLGRVRTTSAGIEFIDAQLYRSYHEQEASRAFLREAFGAIYVSGSIITPSALQLSISAGTYYYMTNRFTPAGISTSIPWYAYYHAAGVWTRSSQSSVSATQYDNGTALTSLTASYYTKHTIYTVGSGANELYFLVYGQSQSADLNVIRASTIPTPPAYFAEGIVLIGAIIVQQGNAAIVEIIDLRPTAGSTGASTGAPSDHGQLTGLLDDDHPQYMLVNGSRTMTGALDMGTNAITNVGLVDGVDVSAHAARHLPNGADALTTAAPLTTLTTATTNAVGTSNSFARSDHTHAIDQTTFALNSIGGTLDVAKGGTGATTLTAGNFLVGAGTSTVATTKVVPAGSVVGTSDAQTLTNKILIGTTNTIDASALQTTGAAVVVSGTSAPSAGHALVATSATTAEWAAPGAAMVDTSTAIVDATDVTKRITFDAGGTTATTTTLVAAQTANRAITLPDATDTLIGRTTTDTLTNKRIIAESCLFAASADNTKEVQVDVAGATTATKTTVAFVQTTNRTLTMPDTTDVMVARATTDTLTNKTITSTTNNIAANSLKTATGIVTVSAASAPTAGQTLVATSATSAEWAAPGATLVDTSTFIVDATDSSVKIAFDVAGTTATRTTIASSQSADRVLTLPDATDTLVARNTSDIMTNKSFTTGSCEFADGADSTKRVAIQASGATSTTKTTLSATQTANRTLSLPDATDTLVGRATTDILTNKTLMTPIISQIVNTGTLTLPTATDTLAGRATTDTLTNKTIVGATNTVDANALKTTGASVTVASAAPPTAGQVLTATSATVAAWSTPGATLVDNTTFIVDSVDATKRIGFNAGGTTGTTTTLAASQTANRTLTLPDTTDTLVGTSNSANISNKSLVDTNVFFVDGSDTSKRVGFDTSAQTTSTTNTIASPAAGGLTWTMPSITATLVGRTTIDNLSGKTIATDSVFADISVVSKQLRFGLASASASTNTTLAFAQTANRQIVFPDISDTVVTKTTTDTLSNKSIQTTNSRFVDTTDSTKQVIMGAAGATTATSTTLTFAQTANRVLTFPDATDTILARATTDTLSNKSIQTTNSRFVDTTDSTKGIIVGVAGATTATSTTLTFAQTANRVLTFPNATDTIVARTTTDTMSNKSMVDSTTFIINTTDNTKKLAFSLGGMTTATTNTFAATGGGFTWTLPAASTTIIGTNTTNTLTNKTITDTTNDIAANSLKTATGIVTVSAASAPSAGQALIATSTTTAAWSTVLLSTGSWVISEAYTSGTAGPTLTGATWTTRAVNTITGLAAGALVTLSGNQIVFEPGTYIVHIDATVNVLGSHKARFRNDTAASIIAYGTNGYDNNNGNTTSSHIDAYITFASTTLTSVQHYADNTGTMGTAISIPSIDEIYLTMHVIKVS